MEKDSLSIKIEYVKPTVLNLGPVTVAYGGICSPGGTPTGGNDCTTGPNAEFTCGGDGLGALGVCAGTGLTAVGGST